MNTLSAIAKPLLILLILSRMSALGGDRSWPVRGPVSLSSSFCDFRPGHFHGGIDIRTGSKEGRKVYSPVDGYIWRIRYSYIGYGKGLYVKDSQGFIYVFGHLSRLSKKLENIVKSYQYENKKYYCDLFFEPDSIPVKSGELIAFSGQTGYGAPHIHFEIRNPDNMPLNPLTNNFFLDDKLPPEFEAVGFVYQDTVSLFPNGTRRIIREAEYSKKEQKYILDAPVILNGAFGVEIKVSDRIRERTMKLNIYRAKLFIDNYLYYDINFEKYDYARTAMVDLIYDYELTVSEREYWHLLFEPPGKRFGGSSSPYKDGGVYMARSDLACGNHEGRVEIYDAAGNMSELVFRFVMLPSGDLFKAEWMNDSVIYFIGQPDNKYLDINSVDIYGTTGAKGWRPYNPDKVKLGGSNDYYITLPHDRTRPEALKIEISGETGWEFDQYIGLAISNKQKYLLSYKVIDGGILFDILSQIRYAPPPTIKIIYEDGYVETLASSVIKPDRFVSFYKNDRIKSKIIRLEVYDPATDLLSDSKDVEIFLGGVQPDDVLYSNDDGLGLRFDPGDFYAPTLIEPYMLKSPPPDASSIVGHAYVIRPITTPLKGSMDVSFNVDAKTDKSKIGLYRLNDKNVWKWVDSKIEGNIISGASEMTGTFAVLTDTESPRIKNIHPNKGKKVTAAYPQIACIITEDLSGIEDDGNITVMLDGHWLIPEYDPETERLKTYPDRALAEGRHELMITATDRVGNSRTVYSYFYVEGG